MRRPTRPIAKNRRQPRKPHQPCDDLVRLEQCDERPHRSYVLVCSGSFDPPTRAHVSIALHAAQYLRASHHVVVKVLFLPVHDNYLANKARLAGVGLGDGAPADHAAARCMRIEYRCALLRDLLAEAGADPAVFEVLPYELTHAAELLQGSGTYWRKRLGDHLHTVPTVALITHLAANRTLVGESDRLGLVFGMDQLAGMSGWEAPSKLLERADLILTSRPDGKSIAFGSDPSQLLACTRYFEFADEAPIRDHAGRVILGARAGCFVQPSATGDSALLALPPLKGGSDTLSSTQLRAAIHVLADHGYSSPQLASALISKLATLDGRFSVVAAVCEATDRARSRGEEARY